MRRLISRRVERSGDEAFGAGELCGGDYGLAKNIRMKGVLDSMLLLQVRDDPTELAYQRA
jgi:hypothetical protein